MEEELLDELEVDEVVGAAVEVDVGVDVGVGVVVGVGVDEEDVS